MNKKRSSISFISLISFTTVLILGSLLFSACALPPKASENTAQDTARKTTGTEVQFPLEITDFLARTVTIGKEPARIVSLSPATTEILFALGVGDRLVGVTSYDDYPPEKVSDIPKVGDFQGPNIEAILAQKPDIIFGSRISGKEQMEALHQAGFPVIILEAATFPQIYDSINLTAQITDTAAIGEKITEEMQQKISALQKKVENQPTVKTFYLVDANGTWTAGKNTFIDELITLAGGENIAGEVCGWVEYSLENLLKKNPFVILTAPHAGKIEEISQMTGFKKTDAVQKGRIHALSDDNIISRPSPRIVQGLEEIAALLHPEVF